MTQQTLEDDDLRKIVIFLGQRFAEVAAEFVPRLGRAVLATEKKVKFSADVTMQIAHDGLIECYLVPKAPKIPTEDLEPLPFLLAVGTELQLELAFSGSREELEAHIAKPPVMTADEVEQDAYVPQDNAVESGLEDRVEA